MRDPFVAVVPGFATVRVEPKDERVLTGVKVTETDTTLTLADNEGKKHEVKKSAIAAPRCRSARCPKDWRSGSPSRSSWT